MMMNFNNVHLQENKQIQCVLILFPYLYAILIQKLYNQVYVQYVLCINPILQIRKIVISIYYDI